MEIPRQKRAGVQFLVVAWGLSLPTGAAAPSFAADAPAPPTLTLAGDPAIAFQGGYIKFSEQVSGLVVGSRESKQLFGMGDVLYIRVLPDANVNVGDRLTLYPPTKQVYHPVTRAPLGQLIVVLGILHAATESKVHARLTIYEDACDSSST